MIGMPGGGRGIPLGRDKRCAEGALQLEFALPTIGAIRKSGRSSSPLRSCATASAVAERASDCRPARLK